MSLSSFFSTRHFLSFLLSLWFLSSPDPIWSQSPSSSEKDTSLGVEINFTFVSNYVFRGQDVFQESSSLRGKDPDSYTGQFAFQPDVTFYTPVEGLYFNMWFSVALANRQGKDVGGKEPALGLEELDEIDYSIIYEGDTKVGSIGFGLLAYTYFYHFAKMLGETELYFSYSPPKTLLPGIWGELISGFHLNIYTTLYARGEESVTDDNPPGDSTSEYFQLGYSYTYGLTDNDIYFSLAVSVNYQIVKDLNGFNNIDLALGVGGYGVFLDAHYIRRLEERFFVKRDGGTSPVKDIWYISFGYGIRL